MSVSMGCFSKKLQQWLELPEAYQLHLEVGLASVSLPAVLDGADWNALLLDLVPSWHDKGTQLVSL